MVDLHKWSIRRSRLAIGANTSLNDTIDILTKVAADKEDFAYCKEMAEHLDLVATVAVRNVRVHSSMRVMCMCIREC